MAQWISHYTRWGIWQFLNFNIKNFDFVTPVSKRWVRQTIWGGLVLVKVFDGIMNTWFHDRTHVRFSQDFLFVVSAMWSAFPYPLFLPHSFIPVSPWVNPAAPEPGCRRGPCDARTCPLLSNNSSPAGRNRVATRQRSSVTSRCPRTPSWPAGSRGSNTRRLRPRQPRRPSRTQSSSILLLTARAGNTFSVWRGPVPHYSSTLRTLLLRTSIVVVTLFWR